MSAPIAPSAAPSSGGDGGGPILELRSVARHFGGIKAVDGVSLSLRAGERLAVIGPNGAGKTTLFRLIAGEMRPTSGTVRLFGQDVTTTPAHGRARLGLARTFQVSNLFGGLTVADNVRLAAQSPSSRRWHFWTRIRSDDSTGQMTAELLDRVGLAGQGGARVAELSHGEQRQLEIAMALAGQPRLLLLDEPAAGLAAAERARLRDLLARLPASLPFVLIEHDMTLALGMADAVVCLHNGRTIAAGRPDDIRNDANVQAIYLGRDRMLADGPAEGPGDA